MKIKTKSEKSVNFESLKPGDPFRFKPGNEFALCVKCHQISCVNFINVQCGTLGLALGDTPVLPVNGAFVEE